MFYKLWGVLLLRSVRSERVQVMKLSLGSRLIDGTFQLMTFTHVINQPESFLHQLTHKIVKLVHESLSYTCTMFV